MTIVLSLLVLGIWPLLFGEFVDKSASAKVSISHLTVNGYAFLICAVLAIILNVVVVIRDDRALTKDSNENKKALLDIKSALEKTGQKYDSVNKVIISPMITLENSHGNTLNNIQDNRVVYSSNGNPSDITYDNLIEKLKERAIIERISDKSIYLLAAGNATNRDPSFEIVRVILKNNGYTVEGEGYFKDYRNFKGLVISHYKNKMSIIIGEMK